MRGRARNLGAVASAVVIPALSIAILHRIGRQPAMQVWWTDLAGWLDATAFEDALAAVLRTIGLAIGYWLLGSTLLYVTARMAGWARITAGIGIFTLPAVRRASDRLVAGSLALATLATPAVSWPQPGPSPVPQTVEVPDAYQHLDTNADEGEEPMQEKLPATSGEESPEIVVYADATLEVVVRPGDNLWDLAARRMNKSLGRPAADHEVVPYWLEMIQANEERIRSGDPDLIFPGEVILLPPIRG